MGFQSCWKKWTRSGETKTEHWHVEDITTKPRSKTDSKVGQELYSNVKRNDITAKYLPIRIIEIDLAMAQKISGKCEGPSYERDWTN